MHISAHAPLHLLHRKSTGALATHSRDPLGYPYPTALPFAPDAQHRPMVLVSRLAEHARNLEADLRAGFLVVDAADDDVLNGERLTLLGQFEARGLEPPLVRRYLRYHPDAERYLALGDFSFHVLEIERMRYIGGFGAMGWLNAEELDPLAPLDDEDETTLIEYVERRISRARLVRVAGVDRYGADLKVDGERLRYAFDGAKTDMAELEQALAKCVADHAK
ncbi:MAG: pyridoxamine 5'-phosphate oxidase family protein [Burkholderiales bacterium]|nr:pyridoxamine 5'-phosphate oxidase family protein [Burkholderiales bacterium]